MQERKFRAVGWCVSETGRRFEKLLPGLGFFFREGERFTVTPFIADYGQVVRAIIERRRQLKNFGKAGTVVFDIQSNHEDIEKYEY